MPPSATRRTALSLPQERAVVRPTLRRRRTTGGARRAGHAAVAAAMTAACALSWIGLHPGRAGAQPRHGDDTSVRRARNHFESGRHYFEDGRYEQAVREFAEAYRLTGHADLLYDLGASYDRLGRHDRAREHYRAYLAEADDPEERAGVERRIAELDVLLSAESAPTNAEQPGERATAAQAAPSTDGAIAPGERPPADGAAGPPGVTVVSWAVAGGFLIGAAVTGFWAQSIHDDLADCTATSPCDGARRTEVDRGRTLAVATDVLLGVGVAAAVTGVLLWLLDGDGSSEEVDSSAAVVIGGSFAGVVGRHRF